MVIFPLQQQLMQAYQSQEGQTRHEYGSQIVDNQIRPSKIYHDLDLQNYQDPVVALPPAEC